MLYTIIVTVVDGGATLERCLAALAGQQDPPPLEILVPIDSTAPDVPTICAKYPGVTVLDMGVVPTEAPPMSILGQHELFDRRRSAGLAAAKGDIISILEDRGAPKPDWARTFERLHREMPHTVIGGPIDNGHDAPLSWAVFFADYARYQPPIDPGVRTYISDINVCYKRAAVEAARDVWTGRFHETSVHWALARSGHTLWLNDEPVVVQWRPNLKLGPLLVERVGWGRLFAHTRALEHSLPVRLAFAVLTPVLPFLMLARVAKRQLGLPSRGAFLRAAPALFMLFAAWSLGEAIGYVTGKA